MRPDKEVLDLIKRLQPSAPVNIIGIAKVLGLNVWESSKLPDDIAGKIFKDDKNGGSKGYSIVIRAQDPVLRKRFTVAHEIAHYLLHRTLFAKELVDDALYRSPLSSAIEAQANGLAADLLMPWHLLMPLVENDVRDLATQFEVSEQAMKIRLNSMANRSSHVPTKQPA